MKRIDIKFKRNKKEARLLEIIIENPIVRDYFLIFSKLFFILGTVFLIAAYAPSFYYSLLTKLGINKANDILIESSVNINPTSFIRFENYVYQPKFNKELEGDNLIYIPNAGIKTKIIEALDADHEEALKLGVWRVSAFGTPYLRDLPTILVAHRYGYLRWSVAYRLKNSFYNLPKVQPGDKVEIVWLQRKYIYEVYKKEEGTEISDYSANLILYTCRDLTTDVKIFVYAKLLEI